jgi:hypothetical protein
MAARGLAASWRQTSLLYSTAEGELRLRGQREFLVQEPWMRRRNFGEDLVHGRGEIEVAPYGR